MCGTLTLGRTGSARTRTVQVDGGIRTGPVLRPRLERNCAVQVKNSKRWEYYFRH